ncbi:MAG: hypothetical protein JXO72_00595 [Vicinamibacteria bacterium]|nr:hypothetical protein [Vicinamibacteria bacterium]
MSLFCSLYVTIILAVPTLAIGQSLAEIARKEAERREKKKEQGVAARVVDENELEQARIARDRESGDVDTDASKTPAAHTTPAETDATLSPRGQSSNDESARRRKQETEWRSRAAQAEARIETSKKRYEQLQSMYLAYGEYYQDSKGQVIASPEQLQAMTARAKADLEAAEKALEDLRDSARRQGVPPGWLR